MSIGKTRENLSDVKYLRTLALEEFYHARQSGRLIALTGSYATQHLGYPNWTGLFREYFFQVSEHLKRSKENASSGAVASIFNDKAFDELKELIEVIEARTFGKSGNLPGEIATDLVDSLIQAEKLFDKEDYIILREGILNKFSIQEKTQHIDVVSKNYHNEIDVSSAIFNDLGIRRVITTNYDLDLERERLFSPNSEFDENVKFVDGLIKTKISRRLQAIVDGRGRVVSDVLSREEPNILIEFLLGSSEIQSHILHIHGRQDTPMDMLLSKRDYRDLYWRRGYSKLPFEYALLALYSGNSILFVGLGMSEADVMRNLEQFRSDNPSRVRAPHFVIWNSNFKELDQPENEADEDVTAREPNKIYEREVDHLANDIQRLRWFRRFGVHVLFDTELAELTEDFLGDKNRKDIQKRYLKEVHDKALNLLPEKPNLAECYDDSDVKRKLEWINLANDYMNAIRMTESMKLLSQYCRDRWTKLDWEKDFLWSPQIRYHGPETKSLRLWGIAYDHKNFWKKEVENSTPSDSTLGKSRKNSEKCKVLAETFKNGEIETAKPWENSSSAADMGELFKNKFTLILNSPGSGKGPLANDIACEFLKNTDYRVVQINGPFISETDSIFSILSGVIDRETAWQSEESRFASIEKGERLAALKSTSGITETKKTVLIFNGLERLVRHDGRPLSIELDLLIRSVNNLFSNSDDIKIIITGTSRIRRYISKLGIESEIYTLSKVEQEHVEEGEESIPKTKVHYVDIPRKNQLIHFLPSHRETYFKSLGKRILSKNSSFRPDRSPRINRQSFFRKILEPKKLQECLTEHHAQRPDGTTPLLADDVQRLLTVLAFIGQPVLAKSLINIQELDLKSDNAKAREEEMISKLDRLVDYGLILPISAVSESSSDELEEPLYRYGLHKSLLAELRVRNGVPHNDAILSSGFNLTLFIAQPSGNYIPDTSTHARLDALVEDLSKTYELPTGERIPDLGQNHAKLRKYGFKEYTDQQIMGMRTEYAAKGVRAALSIVRSYYSTSALLKDGFNNIDPQKNPSPLNQHAARIESLIRVARDIAVVKKIEKSEEPQSSQDKICNLGKALSADDLVYLYNELGVVHLTQGKLYQAGRALNAAKHYNLKFVEFGDKLHNWRRISLNMVQLMIDRGQILAAIELIRDIESSIDDNGRRLLKGAKIKKEIKNQSPRVTIVRRYAKKETTARHSKIDHEFPEELILSTGLCLGYRGICSVLQGAYEVANENYEDALLILNHLGEMRAIAWFKKHLASPLAALGREKELGEALLLSLASAGTTRQADIDHHSRVALAWYNFTPKGQRERELFEQGKIPQLMESLKYAKNNEMRRLQCEVLHLLASVHLDNKDYDSALRYVTDAMAVAAKNGHGLRKIGLRTLIGKILIARGNIEPGRDLLESALRSATKMGYQKAIEKIESERVKISNADGY